MTERTNGDPVKSSVPGVRDTPKDHGVTQQGGHVRFRKGQQAEAEKHPLSIWTGLTPGDVVSLRVHQSGDFVGTVECVASEGLIIWVRDNLNERRLFHFHDCQSVRLLS